MTSMNTQKIASYYNWNQLAYSLLWSRTGLHYGFWNAGTRSVDEAVRNANQAVCDMLDIGPRDRVLDAGCGIGGTSVYIAEQTGSEVVGLTLSKVQQSVAAMRALRSKASKRLDFFLSDYTNTGLPSGSFTKAFCLESANYSEPKDAVVREIYRLLAPGGRVFIVDGYLTEKPMDKPEIKDAYQRMVEGWAMQSMTTVQHMSDIMNFCGFQNVRYIDKLNEVMPSVREIHKRGVVMASFASLGTRFRMGPQALLGSIDACVDQRPLFDEGYMTYGAFVADRP